MTALSRPLSRAGFLDRTRELVRRGDEIASSPSWDRFRAWLLESDEFLESAWGRMDRYHLAWLNVGRDSSPPGSALDRAGEERFMREVAEAKLAVLRTMLVTVEQGRASPRVAPGADES